MSNHINKKYFRCCHITNPEVNRSKGRYIKNRDPNSCKGHKWRLQCFWNTLKKEGVQEEAVEKAWAQIEEIVIKTLLSAHSGIMGEFRLCYIATVITKTQGILTHYQGFDILLDSALTPHLLEVNTRPQLLQYPLDSAVNKPMVLKMFHIVGYHLPTSALNRAVTKLFNYKAAGALCGLLYSRTTDEKHRQVFFSCV